MTDRREAIQECLADQLRQAFGATIAGEESYVAGRMLDQGLWDMIANDAGSMPSFIGLFTDPAGEWARPVDSTAHAVKIAGEAECDAVLVLEPVGTAYAVHRPPLEG